MRRKTPSPVAPFDVVPDTVIEAARRLFDLVEACGAATLTLARCDECREEGQPIAP